MVNKKIILSVLIIGCIATVAGAGTWAYFDDTKVSDNNKITTGTIELTPGEDTLTKFTVGPLVPGNEGKAKSVTLSNTGDVKGYLYAEITTDNDKVSDLTITVDGHEMSKGKKIYLDELPANGAKKTYDIKYKFAETKQNQNDQKKQTVTYTITYYLQQLEDKDINNNGNN